MLRIFVEIMVVCYLVARCFSYYCAVRGLLYYLAIKHDDMLSESKMKELTSMAINRTLKEFFKKA